MPSNSSQEPFLRPDEKELEEIEAELRSVPRRKWRCKSEILLHLVLIALYTLTSIFAISKLSSNSGNCPENVLNDIAISYEPILFKNLTNNPYAGTPSVAVDSAWESMLSSMNIRVTDSELGGLESVSLPNGGKLAWLSVSHNLHCLNLLRQWTYRNHYFPDLVSGSAKEAHQASHAYHCIERIRQASLCQADTASLTVFKWSPGTARPMFDNTEQIHECVNWDGLMQSLEKRVVSEDEWGKLSNPLLQGGS